jgi:hypothetical protein
MKRTTYIIAGIIVSFWIAIPITFLILPKKSSKDLPRFSGIISSLKTTEEITSKVHALKVAIIQPDSVFISISGKIEIGNDKSGSCKLTTSDDLRSFISRRIDNDTLIVTFALPPNLSSLNGAFFGLNINTDLPYVANSVDGMSIMMHQLEQNSISVKTTSEVRIDSCHFHSFVLEKDKHHLPQLYLSNSEIGNLQTDSEIMGLIKKENSNIATVTIIKEEE